METRRLRSSPWLLPLYARTAAAVLPGASRLPLVPGGGAAIPAIQLCLSDVEVDPAHLWAYRRVCEFGYDETLPATYPHVLAFPLHMKLMNDGRFPFGPIGLVHLDNTITQHQPLTAKERLTIAVLATALRPHIKGQTFTIHTEAHVGNELAWTSESTMLRRGEGSGARGDDVVPNVPAGYEQWKLPEGLGRRYADVSGDRNPIHLHALTAKPFGFPKAIAHGMWSKARCLSALEDQLPDSFTVAVRFRRPVFLPSAVVFSKAGQAQATRFALRAAHGEEVHLEGTVTA